MISLRATYYRNFGPGLEADAFDVVDSNFALRISHFLFGCLLMQGRVEFFYE